MNSELDDDKIATLKSLASDCPKVLSSGLIDTMYHSNQFRNLTYNRVKEIFKNLEHELGISRRN